MRKLLNTWGPWNHNPSKPENFYSTNESEKTNVSSLEDSIIENLEKKEENTEKEKKDTLKLTELFCLVIDQKIVKAEKHKK